MSAHPSGSRRQASAHGRGFTLIELLVAVGILLLVTTITLVSVNFALSGDRIKGTARQVQSYLSGARDRAIYAKSPRGVRLLLDPANTHQVTGMIYIGAPELFTDGNVTCDPSFLPSTSATIGDQTGRTLALDDTTLPWDTLARRQYLGVGTRIQIPKDTGPWYRIVTPPFRLFRSDGMGGFNNHSGVMLDRPCRELAGTTAQLSYAMELRPNVLPGEQPIAFPQGVVLDLDGSQVPSAWRPTSFGSAYSTRMDILFSPRGTVIGDAAAIGNIHLLIADLGDSERWANIAGRSSSAYNNLPFVPANDPSTPDVLTVENDQLLVTVATRTGRVTSHPVNPTNTSSSSALQADDPYRFAEVGEVATP